MPVSSQSRGGDCDQRFSLNFQGRILWSDRRGSAFSCSCCNCCCCCCSCCSCSCGCGALEDDKTAALINKSPFSPTQHAGTTLPPNLLLLLLLLMLSRIPACEEAEASGCGTGVAAGPVLGKKIQSCRLRRNLFKVYIALTARAALGTLSKINLDASATVEEAWVRSSATASGVPSDAAIRLGLDRMHVKTTSSNWRSTKHQLPECAKIKTYISWSRRRQLAIATACTDTLHFDRR